MSDQINAMKTAYSSAVMEIDRIGMAPDPVLGTTGL